MISEINKKIKVGKYGDALLLCSQYLMYNNPNLEPDLTEWGKIQNKYEELRKSLNLINLNITEID